jgi:hypothetical protein
MSIFRLGILGNEGGANRIVYKRGPILIITYYERASEVLSVYGESVVMMKFSVLYSALAVLSSFLGSASAGNYTNPLRDVNGGDPDIVWHEG